MWDVTEKVFLHSYVQGSYESGVSVSIFPFSCVVCIVLSELMSLYNFGMSLFCSSIFFMLSSSLGGFSVSLTILILLLILDCC